MEHYYSNSPKVTSRELSIQAKMRGMEWTFISDAGVFSKTGIDFGTRLLIETIEITDGDTILDLGCGYGVVGVVLGTETPKGTITFTDINERAVMLARKNCQRHQIKNASFFVSDGFRELPNQKFNHIVLNPPIRAGKAKIYSMFDDAAGYLESAGAFWIVIHKKHGADSAIKKLETSYKSVEIVNKKSGYQIIRVCNS